MYHAFLHGLHRCAGAAVAAADEVADGEVMDGTEKEEHVSTY